MAPCTTIEWGATTCRKARAFTLVELLVVIAIIALIAAILLPVLSQARQDGYKASCLSNLKQIGTAIRMYMQDWDGRVPENCGGQGGGGAQSYLRDACFPGWISNVLRPYEKSPDIYYCPSRNIVAQGGADALASFNAYGISYFVEPRHNPTVNQADPLNPTGVDRFTGRAVTYGYNYAGLGDPGTPVAARPEALFHDPITLAILWDSRNPWVDAWFPTAYASIWNLRDLCWYFGKLPGMANCGGKQPDLTAWHQNGQNFLYLDGHVKWSRWENMRWQNLENIGPESKDYDKRVNVAPTEPNPL